jgi:hypothetical protein
VVRFEFRSGPFSTDKKVTVVKSYFYTVAEMHDVHLPFSTDRDSARLAISAAQESPWGLPRPWGFSFIPLIYGVLSPLGTTMISAPPQDDSAPRVQRGFSLVQRGFSLRVSPPTLAGMVGTLWPRIHAVLFAYCRLITGFVLAFPGPWRAHPRAVSEYSPEG